MVDIKYFANEAGVNAYYPNGVPSNVAAVYGNNAGIYINTSNDNPYATGNVNVHMFSGMPVVIYDSSLSADPTFASDNKSFSFVKDSTQDVDECFIIVGYKTSYSDGDVLMYKEKFDLSSIGGYEEYVTTTDNTVGVEFVKMIEDSNSLLNADGEIQNNNESNITIDIYELEIWHLNQSLYVKYFNEGDISLYYESDISGDDSDDTNE